MKSTTFKTRQDMLDYFKIEKDPDEVDVITDSDWFDQKVNDAVLDNS